MRKMPETVLLEDYDRDIAILQAEVQTLTSEVQALREERDRYRAESINQRDWEVERNKWQAEATALRAKLEEAEAALDGLDLDEWPGGVGEIEAAFESNLALRLKAEAERDAALGALNAARADAERLADALEVAKEAMDERRGYVNGGDPKTCWQEMKYGEMWDEEDAQVANALAQHREGK